MGAALLRAQDRSAYVDVLAGMAAALAASDASEFLRYIDDGAPDRERLKALVEALLAQAEVTSSVEVIEVAGGAARVDWYMEVRARTPGTPVERRRREVTVKINARQRVTELRPVEFFGPPARPAVKREPGSRAIQAGCDFQLQVRRFSFA
ncbi:MAG TPA: hypothetical protein VFL57_11130 [Bryobacteraceae bacterium]|nr:hypothetical protein [Bryobacteraceae bacterium]